MEKETILAKIRATMSFSEETFVWIGSLPKIDVTYLFCWEEIPGNDTDKFLRFLTQKFDISGLQNARIEKTNDGRTIIISTENKYISLKLDHNITKVQLIINEKLFDELIAKRENDKIKIYEGADVWFKKEKGNPFFSEFHRTWEETLIDSSQPIIQEYFHQIGISENNLPKIKIYESYSGSWIIEAAIVMVGSIGTVYAILKGISELPEISDGLTDLKSRLKKQFTKKANEAVNERLKSSSSHYNFSPPPTNPLYTDFVIDARPLLSITPSLMKSHKIHLNAAISRDFFSIENLGDDIMRDIQIGIFKTTTPKSEWKFYESYMGKIDILSPHQTIAKDIGDFKNSKGEQLNLSEKMPLHTDCWIQDSHGIYLFMFYLDK